MTDVVRGKVNYSNTRASINQNLQSEKYFRRISSKDSGFNDSASQIIEVINKHRITGILY